ncbi:MAG TPA: hypothetical protein VMJ92_04210 [Candidatus Limnocylindrales bacterium]|nr:hypothetical protein [Candidatus Limnocylindrales bacterium]
MSRLVAVAAALAVACGSVLATAAPALAHERREVGPYAFVVGFLSEPAFAGVLNGVSLSVTDARADPPAPVEGLEETLEVEVFHAGRSEGLPLEFRARFGQRGQYAADFVPTREGIYIFHIIGAIGEMSIDERFESGPGRFDEARGLGALQYPDQVPVGADLSSSLDEVRSIGEQTRLLALGALLLGGAALALALRRRRV